MSGAGKSTVLKTLEDLGWEVVDNLPLILLDRLLSAPPPKDAASDSRPLALGIGTRTRDFDPQRIVERIKALRERHGYDIGTLFLASSEEHTSELQSLMRIAYAALCLKKTNDN